MQPQDAADSKPRQQLGDVGRREVLAGFPVVLGLLGSTQQGLPANAADAAVSASPAGSNLFNFGMLDPASQELLQQLNATDANGAVTPEGGFSILLVALAAGFFFGIVLPFLKFLVAGVGTLLFVQVADEKFGSSKNSKRQGQGFFEALARRLSGEPEDELDSRKLEVRRLNDELVGLQANIIEQADGQSAAQRLRDTRRAARFLKAWDATISSLDLTDAETRRLAEALRTFRTSVEEAEAEKDLLEQRYRQGLYKGNDLLGSVQAGFRRLEVTNTQSKIYKEQEKLLGELEEILPIEKFKILREGLKKEDNLSWLTGGLVPDVKTKSDETGETSHANDVDQTERVYVLKFEGDITASQTEQLSREVSAILSLPGPPAKEVVLLLKSPGGSVTGYGLAAAELLRLKRHDPPVKLTVCVDELAASGGYLMACCADQILCSPFAAIGSIGVIAQIPNAAKRLEKEGLDLITTTAGKWKRTVTPFKIPTQEELDKQKEDISAIYKQFSNFVKQYRPETDVEKVATGEVWYGPRAEELKLVDELKTSSQYLLECMQSGAEVLSVRFKKPSETRQGLAMAGSESTLLLELLQKELGKREGGGLLDRIGGAFSGVLPDGGRMPMLRAPEEQLDKRFLMEGYEGRLFDSLDKETRLRLIEKLLS